jgi:ribosomal protein S18 acetylase RimI-like enzyme
MSLRHGNSTPKRRIVNNRAMINIQIPLREHQSLRIRAAMRVDLPALEWGGELKHFHRLFGDAYERVERDEAFIYIAELPEVGLIGQLFLSFCSGRPELSDGVSRGYIYGVRVRPEYRNRGVGTQLMRGFSKATLNVGRDNPKAQRLYERLGYRVVAAENGRWSYEDENGLRREVYEPAWRMEKLLHNHP